MQLQSNAAPHFAKRIVDKQHFNNLRQRVVERVKTLPEQRLSQITTKAIILPLIYFGVYILALQVENYKQFIICYGIMGLMVVVLFVNLIHEACHKNLFRGKFLNNLYVFLFDLLGANSYMWQKRHVKLHHNFTNVIGWDSDIEKSKFLKVHPSDKTKRFNLQTLMFLVYPFFIFNWFMFRDFRDYFNKKSIARKLGPVPALEYFKLFLFKGAFVLYMVVLPAYVTGFPLAKTLLATFVMLLAAGAFALVVLLPPHVNTGNQFPETDENMQLSQSWLLHQLNTTNDVRESNWFTKFVMANFNFHLAHHLFPNISYVYAAEVTEEIKHYCAENNLPYNCFPIKMTFINHYKLIRRNGGAMDILEENM